MDDNTDTDQESDSSDQESDDNTNSSELAQEERDLKSKDATIREKALTKRLNRVVKQNQRFRAERRTLTSNNSSSSSKKEENNNDSNDQASLPAGVIDRLSEASFIAQCSGITDPKLIWALAKQSGLLKLDDNFEVTNFKDIIKELKTKYPSAFTKGNIGGNNGNSSTLEPQTMDQVIRQLSGRR